MLVTVIAHVPGLVEVPRVVVAALFLIASVVHAFVLGGRIAKLDMSMTVSVFLSRIATIPRVILII